MCLWIRSALAFLLTAALPGPASASGDPAVFQHQLRARSLDIEAAVTVHNVEIEAGMVSLLLEEGILFPVTAVGGQRSEAVFLGSGRVRATPVDEIEAGQLELFTDSRSLDAPFEEAVLVLLRDEASAMILGLTPTTPPEDRTKRAQELYDTWRNAPERQQFQIEAATLRDALGDPAVDGFFVAWFGSEEFGDFLYLHDPEDFEQDKLGQWVPIDVEDKDERKIRKRLHANQRRGRMIGMEIEDLGTWDTWMSSSTRTAEGVPQPGSLGFDVGHYEIDLAIGKDRKIRGHVRVSTEVLADGLTAMAFGLSSDFEVVEVRDGDGAQLLFVREGYYLDAFLSEPGSAGDQVVLEIDYIGNPVQKVKFRTFALRTTSQWYPATGWADRATYDVTLHWPPKYDLVAAGETIDEGEDENGLRWIRSVHTFPSSAFSFEIGDFLIKEEQVGHVAVRVAFDRESTTLPADVRKEIQDTVRDSMLYYEEIFGPYPLDYLTVVTAPRGFSQGFLGFVTLSDFSMSDFGGWRWLTGMSDRRATIAHEVAHQWWGNLMGWRSYRDQWLSEAGANYASTLYARNRTKGRTRIRSGLVKDWEGALLSTTEDGRSIESLGPVVLGQRLDSTIYPFGYSAIAYYKGSMVLDMLARVFREDQFVEMLGKLVQAASGREVSTEDFLAAIERMSRRQLDWFSDLYIYGTGFPEVYYTYDFDKQEDGSWRVSGVAEQSPYYHYAYQAVRLPTGFDVRRKRLDEVDVNEATRLIVPFQVLVEDEAEDAPRSRKKKKEPGPTTEVYGRILLSGESTPFQFDLAPGQKPTRFWIDRRSEVLARFYCETRQPKRMAFYHGLDQAGAGEFEKAEASFHEALESPLVMDPDPDRLPDPKALKRGSSYLNGRIYLNLSRLYLDQDRERDALQALETGLEMMTKPDRWRQKGFLRTLEARMEIRQGDYDAAYKRLRKPLLVTEQSNSTEGLILLAIAAREMGNQGDFEEAMERVEGRSVDVTVLTEAADAAPTADR